MNGHRTLEALRVFRNLLCQELGCYVDLYGAQMSPCMWRHWLRDIQNDDAERPTTMYRLMCDHMMTLESKQLLRTRDWLYHSNVLRLVDKLPMKLKRDFYLEFEINYKSNKNKVYNKLLVMLEPMPPHEAS